MQYLEQSDLSKLFRVMYAGNKTHHQIALMCFFSGARISQVLRLQGQDIFEHNGKPVVQISAAKRGFDRLHNLHIDDRPEFDMSPIIGIAKMRPLARLYGGTTRQYFNLLLKRACVEAGIHTSFGHSHCWRHSSAMIVWMETKRLGAVSQFLAHRSASSAFAYLQENDGLMAQEAIDNVVLV